MRALEFPWTVALPVEPGNNPDSCSSETNPAIQTKTEVLEGECEFVCAMPSPSKAVRLTPESELEAAGEVMPEDEAASRISDRSWNFRPASVSEQPPASISAEEQGE